MDDGKRNDRIVIRESEYRGIRAVVLENDVVRATLLPDLGSKMISLVYKPTNKEWLADPGTRPLKMPEYGSSFTAWDMSGWDEMFPTIVSCPYPVEGRYSAIRLPDHGEVWSLSWKEKVYADRLVMSVSGKVLPYTLGKTVSFREENILRIDYQLLLHADEPLKFLWAAHPQFIATEDTEICLPDSIDRVVCVHGGKMLDGRECVYDWPIADTDKEAFRLNIARSNVFCDSRKFYVGDVVPEGWSGLYCSKTGEYLVCSVPKEAVPYLGIWVDEGEYNDRSVIALEPSTGYFDSLELAVRNGKAGSAEPGKTVKWHIEIILGHGSKSQMTGQRGK